MKKLLILSLLLCLCLFSCAQKAEISVIGSADGPTAIMVSTGGEEYMYEQITQLEAKSIIDSTEEHIILDVREKEEYDAGHIPGAMLIPHETIAEKAPEMLPDKDALILVYCRSGRRSKIASEALAKLGYTNVKEFGGINDWKYDIEK